MASPRDLLLDALRSTRDEDGTVDVRRLLHTAHGLQLAATEVDRRVPRHVFLVGGPAVGGAILAASVAMISVDTLRTFNILKEPRDGSSIDGYVVIGSPVVIVDDVVTTGRSLCRAVRIAQTAGLHVDCAIVVLDNRRTDALMLTIPVPVVAIVRRDEL